MSPFLKKLLKNVAAIAIGGALTGGAAAKIDPDHFKDSLKNLGRVAGAGAAGALWAMNTRAPKDE
jgi:hypothetical protein